MDMLKTLNPPYYSDMKYVYLKCPAVINLNYYMCRTKKSNKFKINSYKIHTNTKYNKSYINSHLFHIYKSTYEIRHSYKVHA